MTAKMPRNRSRIFHVPHGVARMIENSPLGTALAAAGNFLWIDRDFLVTRDHVVANGHWSLIRKDGFILPGWFTDKYGQNPHFEHCYWADLQRLVTRRLSWRGKGGRFRYQTIHQVMTDLATYPRLGLAAEVKASPAFERSDVWDAIETARVASGLPQDRVMFMTLSNLGYIGDHPRKRLHHAHALGYVTVILARNQIPTSWEADVTYVRGPWKRRGAHVGPKPPTLPTPKPFPTPAPPKPPEVPVSSVDKLIHLATAEVGTHEGRSGGHWNNIQKYSEQLPGAAWSDGQPWCDTFVHWVAWKAGVLDLWPDVTPKAKAGSAGCDITGTAFKRAGQWSEYPAIGAQVFFGTPSNLSHTGLVIDFNATTITTVEGNTNTSGAREGDGVYLKTRQRRSSNVIGYGYPKYREGIKSADPAWNKVSPKPQDKPPARPPKASPKPNLHGFRAGIDGIDLSHYQAGHIDWPRAKAAGVRFAYHKTTESTSYRDPRYHQRRHEAKAAGVEFGGYHFARPRASSGTAQAKTFLAYAGPVAGDLRPALDLEDDGGLNAEQLTVWVEQFRDEIQRATGKPPVLYAKSSYHFTRPLNCYLWAARYSNANHLPDLPPPYDRWTVWQFSDGKYGVPNIVPGVGHCDINTLQPGFNLAHLVL